jgi:hypothetical protein
MSHLEVDARPLTAGKLQDFVAGTLVMVPTDTTSAAGPFWGLRFDSDGEEGIVRSIIWLNGMPWHGHDPAFYGMPVENSGYGNMHGIACGAARIEIDLASGIGRRAREMRWEQAAGHVAIGLRGSFLVGVKSRRETMWGAHYAIDLASWSEVLDAYRDTTVEWFSRWSVVIEGKREALVLPFDANAKVAAQAA